MKLHNSLTQRKELFIPHEPGHARMYLCGPTVYDRAHIGNARPGVVFDTLFRTLQREMKVTFARNFTDIDDKIIARSREQNIPIDTLTHTTISHYHADMDALNVLRPTHEPKATEYIPQMIAMIEKLIAHNNAYVANGHVLFDVDSYPNYGNLSKRSTKDMIAGSRVEVAPYKKSPMDFVLWKPSTDDQPGWESPWGLEKNRGRGRPGWHIECSAMAREILGETFDIHAGGQDLMFPHHENEIAQSCCAHKTDTYARVWLHNGMLQVAGQKMSKSLGNFLTTHDLLQNHSGEVIRYCLLSTHYRQALNWTDALVHQATQNVDRLYTTLRNCQDSADHDEIDAQVYAALHDDLNTPLALQRLYQLTKEINTASDSAHRVRTLINSARLCGLLYRTAPEWFGGNADIDPAEIDALIHARTVAKNAKDFVTADHIRDDLAARGITVEDSPGGTTWHVKK